MDSGRKGYVSGSDWSSAINFRLAQLTNGQPKMKAIETLEQFTFLCSLVEPRKGYIARVNFVKSLDSKQFNTVWSQWKQRSAIEQTKSSLSLAPKLKVLHKHSSTAAITALPPKHSAQQQIKLNLKLKPR